MAFAFKLTTDILLFSLFSHHLFLGFLEIVSQQVSSLLPPGVETHQSSPSDPLRSLVIPYHCSALKMPVEFLSSTVKASLVAQMIKYPPATWETWVQSLGWGDPLEEGMATHSSILAWRIPMDRGACWATVHGVAKHRTPLSD